MEINNKLKVDSISLLCSKNHCCNKRLLKEVCYVISISYKQYNTGRSQVINKAVNTAHKRLLKIIQDHLFPNYKCCSKYLQVNIA